MRRCRALRKKEEALRQQKEEQELVRFAEQAEVTNSLLDTILSEVVASEPADLAVAPLLNEDVEDDGSSSWVPLQEEVGLDQPTPQATATGSGSSGDEADDEDW